MNASKPFPKRTNRLVIIGIAATITILRNAVAPAQITEAQLVPNDTFDVSYFGAAVSISGDTAIVGAPWRDDGAVFTGAAYVFTRAGNAWQQQQKLTAPALAANTYFGNAVSISGDTAAIGACYDDKDFEDAGSVHIFLRTGSVWAHQQRLTAPDAAEGDYFGISVSLYGNTVIIGADRDDGSLPDRGAAYVFTRSGSVWTHQQKLLPSIEVNDYAYFGQSVAISDNTAIVGSYQADGSPFIFNCGAAFVYTRSGSTWSPQQMLTASDRARYDNFGYSVAIAGDTAAIGAYSADAPTTDCGAAYIFTRSGSAWTQKAKLTAADGAAFDRFGNSIAIAGDTVAVGAYRDDTPTTNAGSAYIFTRSGSAWSQTAKLKAADAATFNELGHSIATNQGHVIAGAPGKIHSGGSGAAYAFDLTPRVTYFAINANATHTVTRPVTLNNTCTNAPTHYMASESPSLLGASWQPYSTKPLFTLSAGEENKRVYFQAKNANGPSDIVSDAIYLGKINAAQAPWEMLK